jgi:hypothetical protein
MDWSGWIASTAGSLLATLHWLEAHPGTASWLVGRENLYRMFTGKENPKLATVIKALLALDIQLMAKPSTAL